MFLLETKSSEDYRTRRKRNALPYETEEEMNEDVTNILFHEYGVLHASLNRENLIRKKRGLFDPDSCCSDFNDPDYPKQWVYVSFTSNRLEHSTWTYFTSIKFM